MRQLARVVSLILLAAGGFGGLVLAILGLNAFNDLGSGGWLLIGWGVGVFCSAAATSCVLSILASIDERLQDAGWLNLGERAEVDAALRRKALQDQRAEMVDDSNRQLADPPVSAQPPQKYRDIL